MTSEQSNNYPPKGLLRLGFRLPVYIYRLGLGWLMGKRFVLINHRGRVSGLPHQAVVEVVERDPQTGTITVVAGYGPRTQWYRNLKSQPEVVIQLGRRKIPVTATFVTPEAGEEIMVSYMRRYGMLTRELFSILGYTWDGSEAELRQIARHWLRFVRFEPRGEKE